MKMTLLSRSREAKTQSRWRTLREEKRDSKSTCSSRESSGRHSSITCQGTGAAVRRGHAAGSEVLSGPEPFAGEKGKKTRKAKVREKKDPGRLREQVHLVRIPSQS